MTAFLSAASVIILLAVLAIVAGIGVLLNLLAGKSRAAMPWSIGLVIGIGLLFFILGGF